MRILVSGSHGLVGSALVPWLRKRGHHVVFLNRSRSATKAGEVYWDPTTGKIDLANAGDLDAVVHLAGENLAGGRWTTARKARIWSSRVPATRLLADTIVRLPTPPRVFVSASAIGYYGSRGDEILNEESGRGEGFLADLCEAWEAAARQASSTTIRVVCLRFGVILSGRGGALAKMLPSFRLGVGGPLGSGRQYWSWITLHDTVSAIAHALEADGLFGPVNVVAPTPVQNLEFVKVLGQVLSRPTVLRVPAFVLRVVLGELANEALLASARVEPQQLLRTGFEFRHSELALGLKECLAEQA